MSEDGKDLEEEGNTKIVPKWKATHITEICMEPEPEEEDFAPEEAKEEEGEGGQTEGEGTGGETQEEGGYR